MNIKLISVVTLATVILSFPILTTNTQAQLNTWIQQSSGTSTWLHGVYFVNSSTGWAVGDGGTILKSTDTGTQWTPQSSGVSRTLASVDFIDQSNGVAVGGKGFFGVILRTTNGGAHWTVVDSSTNLSSVDFVTTTIAWAVGPGGIVKSTNGGITWARQSLPDSTVNYNSVRFFDQDTGWITGLSPSNGVLFKTTNGGTTWMPQTGGIHSYDYIDAIFFLDARNGWMSGYTVPDTVGYGMIKRTTDGGNSWTDLTSGTNQELYSVAFASLTEGWTCGSSGILLHTTDAGSTWIDGGSVSNELDKIFVRQNEGGWIVGLNGTILRNNFGGLLQQATVAMNAGWNMVCLPLSVFDARKTTVFPNAVSNAFRYGSLGYVSDDTLDFGIGYWVKFNNSQSISFTGSQVDSVTENLSTGWNLIGGVSTAVPVTNIIQNPPNSIVSKFFNYSTTGYYTDSILQVGKAYWVKVSQNCTLTIKSTLNGNISQEYLTHLSALKSDEMPPPPPGKNTQDEGIQLPLPATYSLGQNFPNPFNPATTIRFDLPEPSNVDLVVYDVLGHEIVKLVNAKIDAGSWTVKWNLEISTESPLASGLYFYRLDAVSLTSEKMFTEIKKMMFVK